MKYVLIRMFLNRMKYFGRKTPSNETYIKKDEMTIIFWLLGQILIFTSRDVNYFIKSIEFCFIKNHTFSLL